MHEKKISYTQIKQASISKAFVNSFPHHIGVPQRYTKIASCYKQSSVNSDESSLNNSGLKHLRGLYFAKLFIYQSLSNARCLAKVVGWLLLFLMAGHWKPALSFYRSWLTEDCYLFVEIFLTTEFIICQSTCSVVHQSSNSCKYLGLYFQEIRYI